MRWNTWVDSELAAIRAEGRWRQNRSFDAFGLSGALDGGPVISFASNDYLGLSAHHEVVQAAQQAAGRWGTGATASRLIVGTRPCHGDLEAEIADFRGCERALVFPTGYAANLGVLGTLGGPDVTVLSDELNHASIIDGCRLSRAVTRVYRHRDMDYLESLLRETTGRSIVVTDTVFSMDGDVAPLHTLAELAAHHGSLLVIDEAHAVLGPHLDPVDVPGLDLVRVGTLSKTLGSLGGWVAGPGPFIDLLINRARSYIFTTGLSPADAAAALAALRIVRSAEGESLRQRLRSIIDRVQPGHPSPIIPLILGDEGYALDVAAQLLAQGVLVPAIRPPTVAPGTSRLRIALSAGHTDNMVDHLTATLDSLGLG